MSDESHGQSNRDLSDTLDRIPTSDAAPGQIVTNSIGMKLAHIPAGEFLMGSPDSDEDAFDREKPQHRVCITEPFRLAVYPVTQREYERVIGKNPSKFKGEPEHPVECVSWEDAVEFCRRLSALPEEKAAGHVYRLPTEAQWEYACRADSTGRWCFGDVEAKLGDYAWHAENSGDKTKPVGQKKANAWGLYDMHGNVWEWCADWYGDDYYKNSPAADPMGSATGSDRAHRGGSWWHYLWLCRSACRGGCLPDYRTSHIGFRVTLVPSE